MKDWLENQKTYQQQTYGVDYPEMWQSRAVVDYVHTMLTAAGIEVVEAQQEVPWKPWAKLADEERLYRLRDNSGKVLGEIVDVLFFLGNALVALGATDETLAKAYAAKMDVNKQRQVTGYDGISTKCAQCGRALDEPGAKKPTSSPSGKLYCGERCQTADIACGHQVGPFDLVAYGLDNEQYCGTNCAVKHTGGQNEYEDVDE